MREIAEADIENQYSDGRWKYSEQPRDKNENIRHHRFWFRFILNGSSNVAILFIRR